jgi:hypothetical protein
MPVSSGVPIFAEVAMGGAHLGVAVHVALPERLPREQENVALPVFMYPLLHVGVHVLPLVRLDVHVPRAPLMGAVTAQELPLPLPLPAGAGVMRHVTEAQAGCAAWKVAPHAV